VGALSVLTVLGGNIALASPIDLVAPAPNANSQTSVAPTVESNGGAARITASGNGHFLTASFLGSCSGVVSTLQVDWNCPGAFSVSPNVSGTVQWQCDASGNVTFTLTQPVGATGTQITRVITCASASSVNNNLLFVTASPNVVPCGGRTLITANIRNQTGQLQSNTVVHFATDQGLLDPSGSNTAVLTVYPGMTSARVSASLATSSGVITSDVLVQVFCPTPTVQGTPGFTTSNGSSSSGTTPGASTMTLAANPGVVERCGGTVFVVANVKDAGGRPVSGASVLFIATGGTISSDKETTSSDGAATITFTADRNMTGSVKINAQAGSAAGSVTIPIACTASESVQAGSTSRPSSSGNNSSNNSNSSNSSGASDSGSGNATLPPPISSTGAPTFRPPNTGTGDVPSSIRPPSTGEAGLKLAD